MNNNDLFHPSFFEICQRFREDKEIFPTYEKTEWQETALAVSGITPGSSMGLAARSGSSCFNNPITQQRYENLIISVGNYSLTVNSE
jgi:hypothetical protein